jgi:hypothetical protein
MQMMSGKGWGVINMQWLRCLVRFPKKGHLAHVADAGLVAEALLLTEGSLRGEKLRILSTMLHDLTGRRNFEE